MVHRSRWRTFPGGLAAVLALLAFAPAQAQQSLLLVGVYVESNYSLQPGVQVGYSPALLGGGLRLTGGASTTRLATAAGSNALVEDRVQLGAAWAFRRGSRLAPYVGTSAGYARFDREDGEIFSLLDDSAPILSLLLGAEGRLGRGLRLHGHAGYSALQSSTVYPLVVAGGLSYELRGGAR
jgi:hypothetical protein